MSKFFNYRDASGVIREVEAYVVEDFSPFRIPNRPVVTTESGYLHPSLLDPSTSIRPKTEKIVLTRENIDQKKIYLEEFPVGDIISLTPDGGIGQRVDVDFTYIEGENSISWAGLGLEGFLEVNESLEITFLHR
jgi:hypothetical protein